ncbi:MAG: tetratricopeptide repeat protein [bacterium]
MDIKKLEALVKIEQDNPRHWFNLAIAYIQESRLGDSVKALEESIKINPYFAPSYFFIGLLLLFGREFNKGIKYLEKAHSIDEIIYKKLNADNTLKEIIQNLVKASIKVLKDQLEFQPNNIENLSAIGKILLYTDSFDSSINYFRKIVELKPDNWDAYLHLGLAYSGLQQFEQAIFYLKKAVTYNQYLSEAYWIMGKIYQKMGNYGLAVKNYEKAVEMAPNNPNFLESLAEMYYTLERNIQAIKTLQMAIDINPSSKWAYYYLGKCLEKEYNFEYAMEQYEKAISIDPDFTEAKLALVKLYQMNNNNQRAIEILEDLAKESDDLEIFTQLSQLYFYSKQYEKSKQLAQKILNISPEDKTALYLYTLSLVNLRKAGSSTDKDQEIIHNLEKVYSQNPSDKIISAELFKIYIDSKNYQKAKEVWEKSKITVTDSSIAKRIAIMYLEENNTEKFMQTTQEYNLLEEDFILDVLSLLKEKSNPFIDTYVAYVLDSSSISEDQRVRILSSYMEWLYFNNTLRCLDFYKFRVTNELKQRYNFSVFEALLYLTLYAEYKDKSYMDGFIRICENLPQEVFRELPMLYFSEKILNSIKLGLDFYAVIIQKKHDYIPNIHEFLSKVGQFENNVLLVCLGELLPLFLDNSYYTQAVEVVEKYKLANIASFKKLKIEALLLQGKNNEVIRECEEYFQTFSYDSHVNLMMIIANFYIHGEIAENLIKELESIVQESNPLAFAIYCLILYKSNLNEAKKYANRAMEFIYTGMHSFKYNYQILMAINILAKFYENTYQLTSFIKGLRQLVNRYPENYAFCYLLAKYLYITEDYTDAELVIKKALKLSTNSSQLLEAQTLLGKIRDEREKFQKFVNYMETLTPGISEKIAHINTLYKKEKIEEIYSFLSELSNSLQDIILKFYIFDKLEIKEQVVYYLNMLKIIALENSIDLLMEIVENKLFYYSSMEEFEEVKQKAELDYMRIFKQPDAVAVDSKAQETKQQGEARLESQVETQFESQVETQAESQIETQQSKFKALKHVSNLDQIDQLTDEEIDSIYIADKDDFVIACLIKASLIVEGLVSKLDKINQLINSAVSQKQELDELEKVVLLFSELVRSENISDFIVQKYENLKEAIEIGSKYGFQMITQLSNWIEQKYSEYQKTEVEISLKDIEDLLDIQLLERAKITETEELILAYYLKLFYQVLSIDRKEYQELIDNKIEQAEESIGYNEKEKVLVDFLKNLGKYFSEDDLKSCLLEVKNFLSQYGKEGYYSFYSSLVMVVISIKLKRVADIKKYLGLVINKVDQNVSFRKLVGYLERIGEEYEKSSSN